MSASARSSRTAEPLVAADTDSSLDLYERTGSGTTLLSTGPTGGNGAFPANFGRRGGGRPDGRLPDRGATRGGRHGRLPGRLPARGQHDLIRSSTRARRRQRRRWTRIWSRRTEDGDTRLHHHARGAGRLRHRLVARRLRARRAASTTLVSTGPDGGNGRRGAELVDISDDGQKVFFQTTESLVACRHRLRCRTSTQRSGGTTTLMSTGPNGGNGNLPAPLRRRLRGRLAGLLQHGRVARRRRHRQRAGRVRALGRRRRRSTRSGPRAETPAPRATFVGSLGQRAPACSSRPPERLNTTTDQDGLIDVYESTGGALTLLTPARTTTTAPTHAYFAGASGGRHPRVRPHRGGARGSGHRRRIRTYIVREAGVADPAVHRAGGRQRARARPLRGGLAGRHARVLPDRRVAGGRRHRRETDVYESYGGATTCSAAARPAATAPTTPPSAPPPPTASASSSARPRPSGRPTPTRPRTSTRPTCPARSRCGSTRMPDDAQDFSFSAFGLEPGGFNFGPLGFGPTTFQLDDDLDPMLAEHRGLRAGHAGRRLLGLADRAPGWDLTSATCDDGSPVGEHRRGRGRGHHLHVHGPQARQGRGRRSTRSRTTRRTSRSPPAAGSRPTSFSLDDDSDGTLSNTPPSTTCRPAPATRSRRSLPAGWDHGERHLQRRQPVANINVGPGETVTCTFTNHKRGQIVVVKDAQPNDAQDFSFTAGGGLSPTSFSLDDDADGTLSNTRTFSDVAPGSGYSLSETVPSGWVGAGLRDLQRRQPGLEHQREPGENVTCTFIEHTSAARSWWSRTRSPTTRRTSPSRPAAASRRPASSSTTTPNATLSNTRTFTTSCPAPATRSPRRVPSGWDQSSATCDDGSPVSNISVVGRARPSPARSPTTSAGRSWS